MKKFISVLLCVIFLALSATVAFAATRQDVIDYSKEKIPDHYITYHIWAENILGQYDLTSEQWDQVLELVKGLEGSFPADNGASLHQYTKEQRAAVIDALNKFCELTGSTYLINPVANSKHSGDVEILLYKADGTLVATVDGDLYPDQTGFDSTGALWLAASCVLLCLAGVSVFVLRRGMRHSA